MTLPVNDIAADLAPHLLPQPGGRLVYRCLKCESVFPIDQLYYTCPGCGGILLLEDEEQNRLKARPGSFWRRLFNARRTINHPAVQGIFAFHEFLAPVIPLEDIIYLGEGHTPVIAAPEALAQEVGLPFYYKHDGLNPSASFKDRGMAAALSYLKHLIRVKNLKDVVAVCASTGDTSASAALYASALGGTVKSVVLLPQGKVTLPQLSQPLGAGATVIELPGVFDDCMKVVERLAETYQVALLNSKNAWRVLGQESYAFEVARQFDYQLADLVLLVPVGNAGNLTAILSGLLKLERYGLVDRLPKVIAVQSCHANPVFNYYQAPAGQRRYQPVTVKPSVAQAAMIGDPVSFPRVLKMVDSYEQIGGPGRFGVVEVKEQDIIDSMLTANRWGFSVCTQGGEGLAGLQAALKNGLVKAGERAVIDSTAHALKFAEFQNAYFENRLEPAYEVVPKAELINQPVFVAPPGVPLPEPGRSQAPEERQLYVTAAAEEIARRLGLANRG